MNVHHVTSGCVANNVHALHRGSRHAFIQTYTADDRVQVLCEAESVWSGLSHSKSLVNSLHLVNLGDVMWSGGDIVVSLGAAFVNHGTLLVEESSSALSAVIGQDYFAPRILAPEKGDDIIWRKREGLVTIDGTVATSGAGSAGGGAAIWAWDEGGHRDWARR